MSAQCRVGQGVDFGPSGLAAKTLRARALVRALITLYRHDLGWLLPSVSRCSSTRDTTRVRPGLCAWKSWIGPIRSASPRPTATAAPAALLCRSGTCGLGQPTVCGPGREAYEPDQRPFTPIYSRALMPAVEAAERR
jgi:hypothetical protein